VVASSPTALKRWIAIELRRLREEAGHDRSAAAKRIGKASTVVAHIETGRNLPAPADLEVLLNWYRRPERVPFFLELIRSAKRGRDWWIEFTDAVPEWFELYLGLESAAARISSYDALWVPGYFQTREYAEALYRASVQPMTDEELAKAVELRTARQNILDQDDPPQIWCVLDENALLRQVGGPDVMTAQLDRLSKLAEQPHIEIQILPHSAGAHAGAEGTFALLDYPAEFEGDPGTAYIDTLPHGLYYERPDQVTHYRRVFERLQVQAEKPENTLGLIKAAKEKHR